MSSHSTSSPIDAAIRIEGDTAYIPLRGKYAGYVAIVDAEDVDRLSKFKWNARRSKVNCYVRRAYRDGRRVVTVYLHTEVMGTPPEGMVIDHINGDGLDNRKCNLRFATKRQNQWNKPARTEVPFKGISRTWRGKPWKAKITVAGKNIYLGTYNTPEEAARVYDRAAIEHYGEFAFLNFPEEKGR